MTDDDKRTVFARKAVDLAEMFSRWAGEYPVGGLQQCGVEMSAPEGPSTGGGKQGVQHITLKPVGGGMSMVAGSVNQLTRTVELRTWAYMREQQERRAPGQQFRLEVKAYRVFFDRMVEFFNGMGFQVSTKDATTVSPSASPPVIPESKTLPWRWIVGGLLVAAALAVGYLFGRAGH